MLPLHCYIYGLHRCHHLAPHNNKWLMVGHGLHLMDTSVSEFSRKLVLF